ncbi:MAG: amino acid ABC transporter substrate-binding protein [Halomonas sp.]|jgi:general L-amino acid transport system substrate-binding protein|uniref:Amino acid ABC transporter substrate-binding protein n=1 Tax=Billgrantia tianxiuensis TaxID=2497861 RepID=A0A6I6SWI4_9GAMM|nr:MULTISPECIES: amino acid ABC transporter substrate-binding protein [Halomonas]MCE8035358.1 amino acid ABC transporter substrate-binding protein [Halomonas sp. MCCC 1A11057]MDX5435535.1 amino acid ABC transporter substrate-binding protein [Halomonas sp.]MDX5504492.1 amino acid ABC transporter substrate-binding protein [Halomonas sp.]QHC51843.1 amino acid ABC transporter substrate-binding protein [Halomonas tianxiuensis]
MRDNKNKWVLLTSAAALALGTASLASANTLQNTIERGAVQCGVSDGLPGFSAPDDQGEWQGLDVDVCRAVAAAVFGDAEAVRYISLNAVERFTALQSGEVDLLSRNTTWTTTRDTTLGLNFAGVNFYDGIGFMINRDLGVSSAKELDGAAICVQSGTTTELNVADYFRANDMQFDPIVFDTSEQTVGGYEAGRCDVLTSDTSQLAALRIQLSDPDQSVILPEVISKEPLGPVVRQGDDQWFNIVKWSLFAMLNAEEMGVTSENVDEMRNSEDPDIARLLGQDGNYGEGMGLDANWAYNIISQVGNYGESYERNVGMGSPLQIERGINALWTEGGIQYAPPIR